MLSGGEKMYCAALLALKHKDYFLAAKHFAEAAPYFEEDKEFSLYFETTRLLLAVRKELARVKPVDELEIEEVFSNG